MMQKQNRIGLARLLAEEQNWIVAGLTRAAELRIN